ncbi:unnamed protein product [Citrullus colocynthis]|uniref:Uncharacterized protein n=1 Tax=Citrullus colocynthis TaxID=252529 RepID=A0ABP0XRE0_9ROSI
MVSERALQYDMIVCFSLFSFFGAFGKSLKLSGGFDKWVTVHGDGLLRFKSLQTRSPSIFFVLGILTFIALLLRAKVS